jgi:hypothetical protein
LRPLRDSVGKENNQPPTPFRNTFGIRTNEEVILRIQTRKAPKFFLLFGQLSTKI